MSRGVVTPLLLQLDWPLLAKYSKYSHSCVQPPATAIAPRRPTRQPPPAGGRAPGKAPGWARK